MTVIDLGDFADDLARTLDSNALFWFNTPVVARTVSEEPAAHTLLVNVAHADHELEVGRAPAETVEIEVTVRRAAEVGEKR